MFLFDKTPKRVSVAILTAALAIAGCDNGSASNVSADEATSVNESVPTATIAPTAEIARSLSQQTKLGDVPATATLVGVADDEPLEDRELDVDALNGRWVVADVAAGTKSSDKKLDRALVGRIIIYDTNLLGWVGPDGKIEPANRCPKPEHRVIGPAAEARDMATRFRSAWAKFQLPADEVGTMHGFTCDTAGDAAFGPDGGSLLFPVGRDRLVVEWYDGMVLLLQRTNS